MDAEIDKLVILAGSRDPIDRQIAAKDKRTPVEILEQLAADPIFLVRSEVAINPQASERALTQLIADPEDDNGYLVRDVAEHDNVSVAILTSIYEDRINWSQRYGCQRWYDLDPIIACNQNTPVAILVELADLGDRWTRGVVACNPNTPVAILARLAEDGLTIDRGSEGSCDSVRAAVAHNPHTPVEIFARLASDPSDEVRKSVASSSFTPVSVLASLATDPQFHVLRLLQDNPVFEPDLQAAQNLHTSLERLIALSRSPLGFIRAQVRINHPHLRTSIEQLARAIDLIATSGAVRVSVAFGEGLLER
jgi:hypothetical protein